MANDPPTDITEQGQTPGEYVRVIFERVDSLKSGKNRIWIEARQRLDASGEEAIEAPERALCLAYNILKGWEYLDDNGSLDGFEVLSSLRR